jgi:hypothetical protein
VGGQNSFAALANFILAAIQSAIARAFAASEHILLLFAPASEPIRQELSCETLSENKHSGRTNNN